MFRKSVSTRMIFLAFTCLSSVTLPATHFCAAATSLPLCCFTVLRQHLEGACNYLSSQGKCQHPPCDVFKLSPEHLQVLCNAFLQGLWFSGLVILILLYLLIVNSLLASSCTACSLPACKPYGSLTLIRTGGRERTADQRAKTTLKTAAGGRHSKVALPEKKRQSSNSHPFS